MTITRDRLTKAILALTPVFAFVGCKKGTPPGISDTLAEIEAIDNQGGFQTIQTIEDTHQNPWIEVPETDIKFALSDLGNQWVYDSDNPVINVLQGTAENGLIALKLTRSADGQEDQHSFVLANPETGAYKILSDVQPSSARLVQSEGDPTPTPD